MRPQVFQVGGVLYWPIQTRNPDTGVLKDADSTPTVAVRKNGSSVADSVTVTKRSATTGIYDCSYNPAGEAEGDAFTLEESVTITGTTTSSATYTLAWNCRAIAVERGTDGALKPTTDGRTLDVSAAHAALSELDPATRVKLDATQPDYVPATAAALATAYSVIQLTDADVSAMEARLPADPADQSLVEAYVSGQTAVVQAAITAATSPLATSSALSTAAGNITTILGKFTGITLLARWLGILGGKTADSTTLTEFNATTGGTSYDNTTDSPEAIRDRGDAAWITGGSGSESAVMVSTTIATLASQTQFTLTAGSADNDVYNDQLVVITDASTSTQKARMLVSDYVGSTKTVTLASAPGFTIAAGDSIAIIAVAGLTAAQNARLSLLGAGTRQTVKADSGASIELKIGDDYVAAISTAKRIEINDVDGSIYDAIRTETHTARTFGFGYIKAGAKSSDVVTGTIDRSTVTYTAASGSVKAYTTVFVEMSLASTLAAGCGKYDIQVTHSNGKKQTLFTGDCELVTDYKS